MTITKRFLAALFGLLFAGLNARPGPASSPTGRSPQG